MAHLAVAEHWVMVPSGIEGGEGEGDRNAQPAHVLNLSASG